MSKPRKLSVVPRQIVLPAASALVAALFFAVTGASAHTDAGASPAALASTKGSTTLTWALSANPASLFGPYNFSTSGAVATSLVNQTALVYGTYGQLEPQVISSWKQTSPTRYVYNVKPGQRFSNGTPVTAKDVAFSLALHLDPKIGSSMTGLFTSVKRITSSGNQVIVTLKQADATWRYLPAQEAGYVYSKADYEKHPNTYGTPTALPIGTGPYKFQSWQPNSQIVFVRNPYWRGKKYPWDKIVMPIIPNSQALLLAIQNGTVDGTFGVPSSGFSQWIPAKGIVLHTFPSAGYRAFSIDMTDGPFADLHVRRAIAYSIDKAGLVKALLYGAGQPLKCLVPPSMFKSVLPAKFVDQALAKIPGYDFDLGKAKAELKQSSYPNGFTTTLNVPSDCPACIAISQNLQQSLAQIGITVNLNLMPGAPRFQIMLDHGPHLGLQVLGAAPDNPDPADYPATQWPSDQAVKGGNNFSNWRNPTVDKLVKQVLATPNRAAAARLILKGCQLEAQQVSYIPIFTFPFAVAVRQGMNVTSAVGPFYSTVDWLQYLRVG